MFAKVAVDVDVSGRVVRFRFPSALSIIALVVSNETEGVKWEFVTEAARPIPAAEGMSIAIPVADVPPELLELVRTAEESALKSLQKEGRLKGSCTEVLYGSLPPRYRESVAAAELADGEYHVRVFSEQGSGHSVFRVPAA